MQLCSDLYRDGRHVFFHAPTNKYDYPDCNGTCIFVIDNPNRSHEFRSFLERAMNEGHCVVFSLRSNKWAIFRETLGGNIQRSVLEVEMPKLSLDDAGAFAISIKNHLHWVTRSEQELKGLFYRDSYGFSYAHAGRSMHTAMHRASGRSFGAAAFAQRTGAATRLRRRIPTAPPKGQSAPSGKAGGRRPEGKLCPHCNKTVHADRRAPRPKHL